MLAEFDAWAHAECNLTHQDLAQYTPQEIARLQLGYLRREHDVESSGGGEGSVAARKRKFRQRHQQKSEEMFGNRGFQ